MCIRGCKIRGAGAKRGGWVQNQGGGHKTRGAGTKSGVRVQNQGCGCKTKGAGAKPGGRVQNQGAGAKPGGGEHRETLSCLSVCRERRGRGGVRDMQGGAVCDTQGRGGGVGGTCT